MPQTIKSNITVASPPDVVSSIPKTIQSPRTGAKHLKLNKSSPEHAIFYKDDLNFISLGEFISLNVMCNIYFHSFEQLLVCVYIIIIFLFVFLCAYTRCKHNFSSIDVTTKQIF